MAEKKEVRTTNIAFYNREAEGYLDERWRTDIENFRIVREFIFEKLSPQKRDSILDFASGPGTWSKELASAGASVKGVDISQKMVNAAAKNCPEEKFFVIKDEKTPFKDSEFDKIVCIRAFEYFPDKEKNTKEFCRVLKNNGKLLIITKSAPCIWRIPGKIWNLLKKPARIRKIGNRMYEAEQWERKIPPYALKKMLERNGFADIEYKAVMFYVGKHNKGSAGIRKLLAKVFFPIGWTFSESYGIVATKRGSGK